MFTLGASYKAGTKEFLNWLSLVGHLVTANTARVDVRLHFAKKLQWCLPRNFSQA